MKTIGIFASARSSNEPRDARIHLRRAVPEDLDALQFFFDTALRRDYFLRRGQLEEILRGRRHVAWTATLDDVLVGVALLTRGARLVNVLVHPAYRGLGVGRALVEHSGARSVRAKLDMSTGDPTAFYEGLGFHGRGRRNEKGNIELLHRRARRA